MIMTPEKERARAMQASEEKSVKNEGTCATLVRRGEDPLASQNRSCLNPLRIAKGRETA